MMALRCVSGRSRFSMVSGIAALAACLMLVVSAPAEARRRPGGGGGGYTPPFSALVVDANTGKTLYSQDENAPRHPASITKVMTLYLLFEELESGRVRLDTPLRVSAHAASQAPSKLGLHPGDTIEVEDAIKAVVTKSANDVAVTIAENLGGTEEAFAAQMTRKARAIGMQRTLYRNASGLPNLEQITTARDLAILARSLQERFPRYYGYFSTHVFNYDGGSYRNHNHLLGQVDGVDGIKTGYTRMSGFNLLTSAKSGDRRVIGVVLGGRTGGSRDRIMTSLLETHLPHAYAGLRTAPVVADNAGAGSPRAEVVAQVKQRSIGTLADVSVDTSPVRAVDLKPTPVSLVDETPDTEEEEAEVKAPPRIVPHALTAAPVRPTPQPVIAAPSQPAYKWTVGAQPAARVAAYAASPEPQRDMIPAAVGKRVTPAKGVPPSAAASKLAPGLKSTLLEKSGRTGWMIQLGTTNTEEMAKDMLLKAKGKAKQALAKASPLTEKIAKGKSTLYRVRFSGFEPDAAQAACKTLKQNGFSCFAIKS